MKKTIRVAAHGKTLRVVLVGTVQDVQKQWVKLYGKASTGEDEETQAFFLAPSHREKEKHFGAIYISAKHPQRISHIIHECTHAAIADTQ